MALEDLLGSRGDGVNGAHKHIRHHENPEEAVDDASEVEDDPDPNGPVFLKEDGQNHSLHGAGVFPCTNGLQRVNIADVRAIAFPVALHIWVRVHNSDYLSSGKYDEYEL